MTARSEYLGIRLTPQERAALERAAKLRSSARRLSCGWRCASCWPVSAYRSAYPGHAGRAH